jgi:hypothetical protein
MVAHGGWDGLGGLRRAHAEQRTANHGDARQPSAYQAAIPAAQYGSPSVNRIKPDIYLLYRTKTRDWGDSDYADGVTNADRLSLGPVLLIFGLYSAP